METFKYDPIDLERPAFRLLRLLKGDGRDLVCELFQAFLDQRDSVVSYEALSYTWGSTEICDRINVNGRWLRITQNLYRALQDLRLRDQDRVLWVDAICIDQGHTKERGHQVQQMGEIYKNAEQVIVWLGPTTYETDVVIDSLRQLQVESNKHTCKDWKRTDQRWLDLWMMVQPILQMEHVDLAFYQRLGLRSLLDRSWFRRVWILQEAANAQAAVVYCGTKYVQARFLSLAPLLIGLIPDPHCQAVLDILPGPARKDSWWSQSRDLYTLLRNFGRSEAQDERDKIYALLGMLSYANKPHMLLPDYKKTTQDLTLDVIRFLYFDKPDVLMPYQLGTIYNLLPKLRALNKIALKRQVELSQKETMSIILQRIDFEITGEMIIAATAHNSDREVMELLFQQQGDKIRVSEEELNDASQYLSRGKRVMELSLQCQEDEVKGRDAVVKLLLATDANVHSKDGDTGRTQISYAAERGHEALVKLLLAIGANLNAKDKLGRAPLIYAGRNGHAAVVKLLLDQGADWEAKCNDGTSLCCAADNGHEAVVKLLLDRGANTEAKNHSGYKPLCCAANKGHEAVVKLLLDRGADIEAENYSNYTALCCAAKNGHEAVAKLLLDRGADIEAEYRDDYTPLCYAADNGHEAVAKLLLDHGANIEAKKRDGRIPLFKDLYGWTPLCRAVTKGHEAVVKLLLDRGANIESNSHGPAPLCLAADNGHEAMVRLLLDRGANIKAKSFSSGMTLYQAVTKGREAIVKLL